MTRRTHEPFPFPLPATEAELLDATTDAQERWLAFLGEHPELSPPFVQWVTGVLDRVRRSNPARTLQLADLSLQVLGVPGLSAGDTRREVALSRRARAWALQYLGRLDEALEEYQAADASFAALSADVERARIAVGFVWLLRYFGRYQEAIDLAAWALPVLAAAGRTRDAATLEMNVASVYRRLGMTRKAIAINQRSAHTFHELGEDAQEATALMNMGNGLAEIDDTEGAMAAYQRAGEVYLRLGLKDRASALYTNLGELNQKLGRLPEALNTLTRAAHFARAGGHEREAAFAHLALSRTYGSLNLISEALEHSARALAFFEQRRMPWETATTLFEIAQMEARAGNVHKARRLAARAVAMFGEQGMLPYAAMAEVVLAATFIGEGLAQAHALELCRTARRTLREGGWRSSESVALLVEADLLLATGRRAAALRSYRVVARSAERYGITPLGFAANTGIGRLLRASDPNRALEHYERAAVLLEDGRRNLPSVEFRQSYAADKTHVYEEIVALHVQQKGHGWIGAAFDAVERSKSQSLLDSLHARSGGAAQAAPGPAEALRARLSWYYSKLDQAHMTPDQLRKQYERVRRLEAELAQREREQAALDGQTAPSDGRVASLDRLVASLNAQDLLLEYFVAGDELLCFEVSASGARVHRGLGSYAEVRALAEQVRFQMGFLSHGEGLPAESQRQLAEIQALLLGALYDRLLRPLAVDLRGRRLIIVPHGGLHGVPFHALWDGQAYLLDRAVISYAPSAAIFLQLAEGAHQALARPLVVAPDDRSLPAIQEEVDAIAALFPGAVVLRGKRATLRRVKGAVAHADTLHLATHAVFRSDNPWFSGFRLARSWLLLRDITSLGLQAWLAVLSACETGQVTAGPGDELVGLSHAFFHAGCRSLVASLWPVDDRSTALLMKEFYHSVGQGSGIADALHGAQHKLRETWPSPYYWAPFVAIGQR